MSRSSRRRQRKSKQKNNINQNKLVNDYGAKFRIIEQSKLCEIVLCGYIRETTQNDTINDIPIDVAKLCSAYFGDSKLDEKQLEDIIKSKLIIKCYNTLNNYNCNKKLVLKFNDTFNGLYSFQKILVCTNIINRKFAFQELRVWQIDYPPIKCPDHETIQNAIFEQLYFIEYMLWKKYDIIEKLDLSDMNLNDNHILYFCNAIENMIKYDTQQKQNKLDEKNKEQQKNIKSAATKPIWSKDKRVQMEFEKQMQRKRDIEKERNKVKVSKMALNCIDLSSNAITDKYMPLILRTIKKYMPEMKTLRLSSNNITNKSLQTIMKYHIDELQINLSDCKDVTLKGLNKYLRRDYDDPEDVEEYVYCERMVYFFNDKERIYDKKDGKGKLLKKVRGKGRKYHAWNRKQTGDELYWFDKF